MLYNIFFDNFEYDECNAKGSCSVPPSISALQEVLLICLRQLAFYILKLREFGINCKDAEDRVINSLATIITTTDYSDEQLLNVVSKVYSGIESARKKYIDVCKERNIECKELKLGLNITPQMNLSQIMALGEKAFLHKYKKTSQEQKNMTDILLSVIKSTALNSAKLASYSIRSPEAILSILNSLDILNHTKIPLTKCKTQIKELAHMDMLLSEKLAKILVERFGPVIYKEVSHSTTKGKAILVSGDNLLDLKGVLDLTEEKEIDVYTHGELIVAHAFEIFSHYKSLKGHFGTCNENCILDFATFPGSILLTQNSNTNTEYLYRGRLFTTAKMPPQGVISVDSDNLKEVVESAENARGFAKGQSRASEFVGYDNKKLSDKLREIGEKFKSEEIKHIFILGLSASRRGQKEYFQKLISKLPDNCYVISFSFESVRKNFMHINLGNSRPLILEILKQLFEAIPLDSKRVVFFLARCDVSSISNMINLIEKGVKNIYLSQCHPNIINPAILTSLDSIYNIKTTSQPEKDLEEILK